VSGSAKPVDRGALYYPYIHVRDTNWLKATLLCFPFVDRMVPESYSVNDNETAAFFSAQASRRPDRRMLGRRDLGDVATEHARLELLHKLEADAALLTPRFSREAAKAEYKDGDNAFQIHEHKIGGAMVEFLKSGKLVWPPTLPVRGGATWWAVHPVLGEAIMSTNAVALAQAHDLEIVTSEGPVHQSLLGTTASTVYDTVIRHSVFGLPRPDTEKVNDLLRFVILSSFDLDKLSPADIADLNRQRADISALKSALLAQVDDLGAMPDRQAWNDVLAAKAKDVLGEWESLASVLSVFARAKPDELVGEFKGYVKDIAPGLLAGTAASAMVGALPGLVVGVLFAGSSLVKEWYDAKRPYRLLSRLGEKAGRLQHSLEASTV
jgi:hypothetical protein